MAESVKWGSTEQLLPSFYLEVAEYGQKIIDIQPHARYNIVNLIRKPSDYCYDAES